MGEPCPCAELEGAERAASLERGGNGRVAHFAGNSWRQAACEAAQALRPSGNAITLHARARLGEPDGQGTLFFSDSIGLGVHRSGLAVGFLGQQILSGVALRELPLAVVERGRWLDLVLRVGDGGLQFFCDGVLRLSVPIEGALRPPCRAPLNIGAFHCRGSDNTFFRGSIERVALWNQALTDAQVAALSGVEHLTEPGERGASSRAILAYNRFFDASARKDIVDCGRQEQAMREVMAADPHRPIYHLTAPLGWMYDPAGAFYHQGLYHVFTYRNITALLQYCSLDHFVSHDLVHWRQWPVGPWADCPLDICGIWLNNHFVDDRGELNVLYTAHGEGDPPAYVEQGIRARSLDGMVSFVDKKRVVARHHDGHTWKEGDTWYTLTTHQYWGSRPGDAGDALILLSSTDLDHWTELGEIFTQKKDDRAEHPLARQGFMEFPYLLPFGDREVLILGGLPVRYWIGRLDREAYRFIPDEAQGRVFDYANPFHCFNPLIVDRKGPGGAPRRVVLAMVATAAGAVGGLPWNGAHAMPRTLALDGDHLRQDPLPEFEALRGAHTAQRDIRVAPDSSGHIQARGDALEIRAVFEPGDARVFGLKVRLSDDGQSFVRVFYDARTGEYGVDGNVVQPRFGGQQALVQDMGRGPAYLKAGDPVVIRVFLDKCLVETFVNGQTCTTIAEDPDGRHEGLDLFSQGGVVRCTSLDVWQMNRAAARA